MIIHPLVIHFPIALLTVYSLLELLSPRKIRDNITIKKIKAFLVIVGAIFIVPSILTGTFIEDIIQGENLKMILEMHEKFAFLSAATFAVLALLYLSGLAIEFQTSLPFIKGRVQTGLGWLYKLYLNQTLLVTGALLGFLFLVITGSLGGILVHGQDVDPFAKFLYTLIVK